MSQSVNSDSDADFNSRFFPLSLSLQVLVSVVGLHEWLLPVTRFLLPSLLTILTIFFPTPPSLRPSILPPHLSFSLLIFLPPSSPLLLLRHLSSSLLTSPPSSPFLHPPHLSSSLFTSSLLLLPSSLLLLPPHLSSSSLLTSPPSSSIPPPPSPPPLPPRPSSSSLPPPSSSFPPSLLYTEPVISQLKAMECKKKGEKWKRIKKK